jgi:N-acetylglucosaminyldiphosphoundecaprenol N-acetyl-beta-D-mannosaminyltransferase
MRAVFVVTGWKPTRRSLAGSIVRVPPPPAFWTQADAFGFGDIPLLDTDIAGAVDSLAAAALAGEAQGLHLCNAYTLALAMRDPAYCAVLQHPGAVNLPDGTPVSWFHRLAGGRPTRGPVRGPGLLKASLARPGLRHYLLGGTEELLDDLEAVIVRDYPAAIVAGRLGPRFGDPTERELEEWATAVRGSGANILWVGLGTPRQDQVIARLTGRTGAVAIGVGAAFDFLSGHKAEAPELLHRTGLEWVYRLLSEPRRLWRRYLFGNAAFVIYAVRQLPRSRRAAARVGR